jgi:hypothetical protein
MHADYARSRRRLSMVALVRLPVSTASSVAEVHNVKIVIYTRLGGEVPAAWFAA